jgi:uncharacterized integral membrane protein
MQPTHIIEHRRAGFLERATRFLGRPSVLGPKVLSERRAQAILWVARAWTLAGIGFFVLLLNWRGAPFNEYGGSWQEPAQIGLLAIVALGWIIAWQLPWLGASLVLGGAVGLGVLAAVEYRPSVAFFAFLIFLVPAVLYWLFWQRRQPLYTLILLGAVVGGVLGAGAYSANEMYQSYYGPTHPDSTTVLPPAQDVDWAWSGAATTETATVKAGLTKAAEQVRLAVGADAGLDDAAFTDGVPIGDAENLVYAFDISGLQANTEYHYAVEVDGELDAQRRGRFTTMPVGPATFTFAFGSCIRTGSNGSVFDEMRELDPLFLLNPGDFIYASIEENDPALFFDAYRQQLISPAQSAFYRSTSLAHIWDDHDFGPNDSDRTSPARDAALSNYNAYIPHYPLASGADGPIYQAFTVGWARFIMTDLRSARDPAAAPDGPDKTMLGAEQKEWFKRELLAASEQYPVIFWVSSVPWIAEETAGADDWGGYTHERREIANFIAENGIDGLVILSGDAHMLAIDDGTNSNYAELDGPGPAVFHAAAIDQRGSAKGGPFSEGSFPDGGQFGLVTVHDDGGDQIEITLEGRNWDGEQIVSYTFTVDAVEPAGG